MEEQARLRILLAGSAAEPEKALKDIMTSKGWAWEFVEEQSGLLQALKDQTFDVVVIDRALPDMDPHALRDVMLYASVGKVPVAVVLQPPDVKNFFDGLPDFPAEFRAGRIGLSVLEDLVEKSNQRSEKSMSLKIEESIRVKAGAACLETPEPPILEKLQGLGIIDLAMRQRILLAFQEAFTNALEHGSLELLSIWKDQFDSEGRDLYTLRKRERLNNPSYAEREVVVQTSFDHGALMIRIQDEGRGFSLGSTRETLLDRTPVSFHGRGLTIIGNIMDEVTFAEDGTEIVMVKYLG